jgi:hypothetical protein
MIAWGEIFCVRLLMEDLLRWITTARGEAVGWEGVEGRRMKEAWGACCEERVLQMETSDALKPLMLEGRLEKPSGEKPVEISTRASA